MGACGSNVRKVKWMFTCHDLFVNLFAHELTFVRKRQRKLITTYILSLIWANLHWCVNSESTKLFVLESCSYHSYCTVRHMIIVMGKTYYKIWWETDFNYLKFCDKVIQWECFPWNNKYNIISRKICTYQSFAYCINKHCTTQVGKRIFIQ